MTSWQQFEEDSFEFLLHHCGNWRLTLQGGSNATVGDVFVEHQQKDHYTIEIKQAVSQAGQIVLYQTGQQYTYSAGSKRPNQPTTQRLIDWVNEHFHLYEQINQRGLVVDCAEKWLFEWLQDQYQYRNVRFVLTEDRRLGKILIPVEKLPDHFRLKGKMRRKKSGTRHVPMRDVSTCLDTLRQHIQQHNWGPWEYTTVGTKHFVTFSHPVHIPKTKRYFGTSYYLSPDKTSPETFMLRQRSNTNAVHLMMELTYLHNAVSNGVHIFH